MITRDQERGYNVQLNLVSHQPWREITGCHNYTDLAALVGEIWPSETQPK